MVAAPEEEEMEPMDLSLKSGITLDDVEMAGIVALARMSEWREYAKVGLMVVGTHYDTVSTWDPEEGDYYWEDIVVEVWTAPERLVEAQRIRTWWDRAAQAGFDDWA